MIILGIETSCDETAAAIVEGRGDKVEVLSNVVASQIELHKKYGGVVPEVAAREHVLNILPVVNEALEKAGITPLDPPFVRGVNAIAITVGPGLVTSLLVGVETAKTLAYAWKKPVVAVNHIEGHIYANFINNKPKFPALILTVSGGHTMLILMSGHGKYKVLGETRDDAAGEAFDKAAQLLKIGYPGGPAVAKVAEMYKSEIQNSIPQYCGTKFKIQNSKFKISLPRPMINDKSYDFSFSGLKTALLYEIQKDKNWKKKIPEYAAEFQQAVVDVLVAKTIRAAGEYKARTVMLSGGVAANQVLRQQLALTVKEKLAKVTFTMPELKYCTDNAAMVAVAGYFRARNKKFTPLNPLRGNSPKRIYLTGFTDWSKLRVDGNLELK